MTNPAGLRSSTNGTGGMAPLTRTETVAPPMLVTVPGGLPNGPGPAPFVLPHLDQFVRPDRQHHASRQLRACIEAKREPDGRAKEAALPFEFDSRWHVRGTAIRNRDSANRASVGIVPAA